MVSDNVPAVVSAIWDCLVEDFMAEPTAETWRTIAEQFVERWNFPLRCGALDGEHVVLKAPPNSGSQFFNYKGTFSIVLLAVVNANYRFRVTDVWVFGRTSDGGILANSAFGRALRAGTLHLPADQPQSTEDPSLIVPTPEEPHEAIPWAHPPQRQEDLQLPPSASWRLSGGCTTMSSRSSWKWQRSA